MNCGGTNAVTGPANTTQAGSTFTVHITSPTTAATAGPCPGTGTVDNTGHVSTGNDGSDQGNASTCVNGADIHIVKTADAASVNAGEQIGFTMTVYISGAGNPTAGNPLFPYTTLFRSSWSVAG